MIISKRTLLLCTLLLLAACAGSGNRPIIQDATDPSTPTPAPTSTPFPTEAPVIADASGFVLAFLRAWEGRDFLGMYSLLSPQSQALVDSQAFIDRYTAAMETATVQSISTQLLTGFQEAERAEFGARITWETAVVGNIVRDLTVPLVFNNGRWGIVWDEGLILPELSGGNRLSMEYRIPARANIYDINGRALAYQGNVISIGVIPGQIEDEEGMLAALSNAFNLPPEEIEARYAEYQPDWYAPIGSISESVMQANATALQPYIGAGIAPPTTSPARLYSEEGLAPHLVGYTGFIPAEQLESYKAAGYRGDEMVGLANLEAWGEDYLNGERGGILTVVGPNGEYITTIQEQAPKQARSIYTTVAWDFQAAVEQALAEAVTTLPGGSAGAIVVLDVNTGAVKAMASYPDYDPSIFDSLQPDSAAQIGELFSDPGRPLLNRATQSALPAGSVFKIVTMIAGLNSGMYTPETTYTSTGTWERLGEEFIKTDWREGGHGTVTLRQALIVSCNSCFYDVSYNLDQVDSFLLPNTAREFGLGAATGISGLSEATGLIPDPEWKIATIGQGWVPGDAANMGTGQGDVLVTPLQIANLIAAVANGGTLYRPTLVDRIGAGGGAPEEAWPQETIGSLPISDEHMVALQDSLWQVANNQNLGTAAFQFVGLPVQVAGKTGTAEAPPNAPHAWFTGYAPAAPFSAPDGRFIETPEIAVAVVIENAGEGSAVAAPIFRRIVELYYGIQPVTAYPW